MGKPRMVVGSFAPPLSDAKLAEYSDLAETATNHVIRGHMKNLIKMLEKFRQTPASALEPKPHPVGVGTVTPLEQQEVERMNDVVPTIDDCRRINDEFDRLPNGNLRNAAYHLLWFAVELAEGREPCTNDKL